MDNQLATTNNTSGLQNLGALANTIATANVFAEYHASVAQATITRHANALDLFAEFCEVAAESFGVDIECLDFQDNVECWRGVTFGLVLAFKRHLLDNGYAIGTVNQRINTIRKYATLAHTAGIVATAEYLKIKAINSISHSAGINIDAKRDATRTSNQKESATTVTASVVDALKHEQPDTPAGRRNALIACLLFDHGLRASEIVALTRADFDTDERIINIKRKKTKSTGRHRMTRDTYNALLAYMGDMPATGGAFVGSYKDGRLRANTLTTVTLTRLVGRLGKAHGIDSLSAHDARHYCATDMAKRGESLNTLMEWFGWTSPAMAMRYINAAEVAERTK